MLLSQVVLAIQPMPLTQWREPFSHPDWLMSSLGVRQPRHAALAMALIEEKTSIQDFAAFHPINLRIVRAARTGLCWAVRLPEAAASAHLPRQRLGQLGVHYEPLHAPRTERGIGIGKEMGDFATSAVGEWIEVTRPPQIARRAWTYSGTIGPRGPRVARQSDGRWQHDS